MIFQVRPVTKLSGAVSLPASKSYSIRAFFVAACGGASRIIGASDCDDAKAAMRVVRALAAPAFCQKKAMLNIDVGESGTSLRFLLPLLPHFTVKAKVSGRGTLVGRPNHHLCAALRAHDVAIKGTGPKESIPVVFSGGNIPSGRIAIDGSLSSQFISALMIAATLSGRDTRLVMTGKRLVSQDYVAMTRLVLARAGIDVRLRGSREFFIRGGQAFKGLKQFHVPSDLGLAAFFMAAAALVPSDVMLKGHFDDGLPQADGAITGFCRRMGVRMARTRAGIRIKGPFALKGGTFSLKDCPDLVPVMTVMAMFASGPTRLKDIGHARAKESDRISDLRAELRKAGADIRERPDELVIYPRAAYKSGAVLDPHHDHRLAMAFAVLGLKVAVKIKDIECTSKSYPGFAKAFRSLYNI